MNSKLFYVLLLLCLHADVFVLGRQPNILLIIADDYGWHDIGYHGSIIKTPTLDALAGSGVKLDNYYVQPICTPSRSQLLSGRYQIHTGLQHAIIWADQPNGLPLELPTLANKLKDEGYATHMIGKWHLGFYKKEYTPTHRGFDSFYGYLTGGEDYYKHNRCSPLHDVFHRPDEFGEVSKVCGLDFHHNMDPVLNENGSYSAHVFVERAEKLVENHAKYNEDQPLFLYMPFQSVHSPMQVPDEYAKKYSFIDNANRRIYAGMVAVLDEAVANVTKAFQEHGLWDNTIVVFSTDNGGQILSGGNNWPLRGNKATLWEGGVRGVGFVSGPVLPRQHKTTRELIHISDWYPTLVELAGGSTAGLKLDGYSMWDMLSQGQPSPRKEILHNIDPLHPKKGAALPGSPFDNRVRAAIRSGEWKLITGDPGMDKWTPPPHLPHLNASYTSDEENQNKNLWLFNVVTDPDERKDVSTRYPDVVKSLLQKLANYNATAVPPRYPKGDPRCDPKLHGGNWGPWED